MAIESPAQDHFIMVEADHSPAKSLRASNRSDSDSGLPTYEEATNPAATAPPTYEALFGPAPVPEKPCSSMREIFIDLLIYAMESVCSAVVFVGRIAIPIAMIVMGLRYLHECPQAENIPSCLIVGGILGVFKFVLYVSDRMRRTTEEEEDHRNRQGHSLLSWFMIAWLALDSFWVYQLKDPNYDPEDGPYCDRTIYLFAYWLVTSMHVCLGFATFCVFSVALGTFLWCPEDSKCE